jgi:ribosomal protein L11 methyltransferase
MWGRLIILSFCLLTNATIFVNSFLQHQDCRHFKLLKGRSMSAIPIEEFKSASKLVSLKFIQLTKRTEPGLLADYLMEIGASSVSITDHDANTEEEVPIFAEPEDSQTLAAVVSGDAGVGKNIWLRSDVTAHFTGAFDPLLIVDNVRTAFDLGTSPRFEVDQVPDLDWVKVVQSSWKPCLSGGFVLRFPWHTDEDIRDCIDNSGLSCTDDYKEIQLEGGIAFGTGEHPTTQLCLEWITQILQQNDNNIELFLDYGAGSGVLGIAACKLKPHGLQAVGVEIDSDAIQIADSNSASNNVRMKSYLPRHLGDDDESASLIMKAIHRSQVEVLPEQMTGPRFDACAANILARPLISLAETIASMLKPGAPIGLSGILEWQGEEVVEAYSKYFDDVKIEKEKAGWILVSGTRKASPTNL